MFSVCCFKDNEEIMLFSKKFNKKIISLLNIYSKSKATRCVDYHKDEPNKTKCAPLKLTNTMILFAF